MKMIDIHSHCYPQEFVNRVLSLGPPFEVGRDAKGRKNLFYKGARVWTITDAMGDVEGRLEALENFGICHQILSAAVPFPFFLPEQEGYDLIRSINDAMCNVCDSYSRHFSAIACLPLTSVDNSLRELERAVDKLGMKGVIIGTNVCGKPLDSEEFLPLFAELNRRQIPVFLHPVTPAEVGLMKDYSLVSLIGFMFETTLAVSRMVLSGLLDRFPNLTMVLAHMGGTILHLWERIDRGHSVYPDAAKVVSAPPSEYFKRFYFDVTCYDEISLNAALKRIGPERLLFGTDFPHPIGNLKRTKEIYDRLDWDEKTKQAVFFENARRLYRLPI